MLWRFPHNPTAYDDDWEDQPAQGAFYQWVLGVALPLVFLGFGIHAVVTQHAVYGDNNRLDLYGLNAIAFGVAGLSAALFLHCHYFWGNIYNQAWFAVLGKILAACGFIAGLGIMIVRIGVYGMN